MHNSDLVLEILQQIYGSTQKVLKRFETIKTARVRIWGHSLDLRFPMRSSLTPACNTRPKEYILSKGTGVKS